MAGIGAPKGNDYATKGRLFRETLDKSIKARDFHQLRAGTDALMNAVEKGEPWALAMVADRLDGKAVQQIDATVDANLTVEIVKFSEGK